MLKQRALAATIWSGLDIAVRHGLQFIIAITLAHFVSPEEFGVIALLSLFIGLSTVLVDGGFSWALIQRQDVDLVDESTVFWFNTALGAAISIILLFVSPAIAAFYNIAVLAPLIQLMGLNVLIGSLGATQNTLLSKRLDFRTQTKIGVIATIISGGVAVFLAVRNYGVWALAGQMLTMTMCTTLLLWLFNGWRPTLTFSLHSARRLFGFGGYLLAANLSEMLYSRLYTLLIGKYYGVQDLGFYTRADSTKQIPTGALSTILARVSLPLFSAAAQEKDTLRRGVQLATRGLMLVNLPMMFGLAALAEPLVLTLFGARWRPAAPILSILCIAAMLGPLHILNLNVLMAQGHARLVFRLELVKKPIGIALLISGGAIGGVMGIAWAEVVFSMIAFVINAHYTGRFLDYGLTRQTRDFLPSLIVSLLMATSISVASRYWHLEPSLELIVMVAFGIATFYVFARLARIDALQDVTALLNSWRLGTAKRSKVK